MIFLFPVFRSTSRANEFLTFFYDPKKKEMAPKGKTPKCNVRKGKEGHALVVKRLYSPAISVGTRQTLFLFLCS
jgi:hypothetical protein